MDPFVTRIGDVTIERVAPKISSETSSGDPPSQVQDSKPLDTSSDSHGEESTSVIDASPSLPDVKKEPETTAIAKEEDRDKDGKGDNHTPSIGERCESPEENVAPGKQESLETEKGVKHVKDHDVEGDATEPSRCSLPDSAINSNEQGTPASNECSNTKSENEVHSKILHDKEKSSKAVEKEEPGTEVESTDASQEGGGVNGDFEGDDNDWENKDSSDEKLLPKTSPEEEQQMKMETESPKEQEEEQPNVKVEKEEAGGSDEEEVDIKKKLRTRQKRKIVVEEDSEESEEERKKKRKRRKKKGSKEEDSGTSEETESEDDGSGKKKKKKKKGQKKGAKKKDDDDDGSGGEKSERKATNLRRNIREVMDETQLDEATLAAQRQEMERLQRVQEQQRILREMAQQRQQQQKAESRVISLLQGNTSILKQVSVGPSSQSATSPTSRSSPNTVVVKVGSGPNAQMNKKVLELLRVPKGTTAELKPSVTKTLMAKPRSLQGTTMMTPSVSIAPVRPGVPGSKPSTPKLPPIIQPQASYSASEGEDDEELDEEALEELEEGKKKKKDVVTISSSSSSEDDCIVLSEPSDIGEDEEEDDPTNSGMHTNDLYNVPDDEGRVQVNMGKPEGDPDIFLAPHIARIIKPHQIGGIRFLFDNVIESIERFNTSTGFGCILAHSMGLGKTLQVVTFCDIFLRHTPGKTVMCIMPINTLQNWLAEFNMWMPEDPTNSPLAAQGEVRPRNFGLHVLNDSHKTLKARAKVIEDWSKGGGVLLIGYEMYRQLSLKKVSKPKKSRSKKKVASDEEELAPEEEEKRQKEILEKVYEALVKPGPDLVICDEGHRIKNSHASISMALKQIRSKRRIVLTGYPLQNNLLEYWCMVDFVRPNYLGSKTEFCNMFERPIQNGQCIDSTPQDIRLMRYRAHVLHSLLEGFVQRRSHAVLQSALPQKEEYVLLLRMTPFQRKLYDTFMNEVVRTKAVPNPLKAFAVCCKIWNHPDVLYQFLKKREGGEGVDLDLEEAAASLATNTVIDPTGTPTEERRPTKSRNKSPGVSKSRKKKDTTAAKPAAAVLPNTSSQQSDPTNPYGVSGQYPMHSQMNSNSMMGGYNPYGTSGQSSYSGPFSSSSHHYSPNNPYGHPGYTGNAGFNAGPGNLSISGSGSFPSSTSSGYGDSIASSPASQNSQYGSSSQAMFSSSSSTSSSTAPGYGSMGSSYFSGNSPSGQHPINESFASNSNYNPNWNNSNNYNSFSQGQPNAPPPFSGQGYNSSSQSSSFQGYSAGSSSNSFSSSMYGSSNSGSSGGAASQPYSLDQQQMLDQGLMQPPNRPNHTLNPNLLPQQSPVNASGMLPGGAPTKSPAMIPPNMLGAGMNNMSGLSDSMMSHHNQGLDMSSSMYSNPGLMDLPGPSSNHSQPGAMSALSSMASADVPPTAEDLLHSSDDFRAFDPALGKSESSRGMYEMKDRGMYDAWSSSQSHSHDFSLVGAQDMKSIQDTGLKLKTDSDNKFNSASSPMNQLKSEMRDVKLDDKHRLSMETKDMPLDSEGIDSARDGEVKRVDSDTWRVNSMEMADQDMKDDVKEKEGKEDEEGPGIAADGRPVVEATTPAKSGKEDPGIPYDWAVELMKDYVPGLIENSAKMVIFFCILEESLALGDRVLVFSQSLFTLSLIEEYLQRSFIPVPGVYERWQRNRTYYRLDGSTAALEREKLINEFNANPNVYLFLVSTRAGSLGINLVGANRVIVFDASWNPCHDTQAVCRVYRYGQKKPCYVYRLVMDNCLEKKIYDRQINKQGMSDRVVDECNPDAHLSIKEVTNLCWDDEKDTEVKDISSEKEKYRDTAVQKIVEKHWKVLSKPPFQHESLLVDRKDKKLSQAEKRLAKRSYEMEKRANNRPTYNYFNAGQGGLQIRPVQRDAAGNVIKPIASVRPMQAELNAQLDRSGNRTTKWIPAEVWQRQGMSAQEMTLPLDVVIPTNSPERASIVLKAGQRVMVLKSPKGIYMQLENGKIIAIRTAFKMGANNKGGTENKPFSSEKEDLKKGIINKNPVKLSSGIHPLRNNPNITITPRNSPGAVRSGVRPIMQRPIGARIPNPASMRPWVRPGGVAGRAVPLRPGQTLKPGLRGLSPSVTVTPANSKVRALGPVTMSSRLVPANLHENMSANHGKLGEVNKDKGKGDTKIESRMEHGERLDSDDGQSSNSSSDFKVDSHSNSENISSDFTSRLGSERKGLKIDSESFSSRENSRQSDSLDGNYDNSDSRSKTGIMDQSSVGVADTTSESNYPEENANNAQNDTDVVGANSNPSQSDSSKVSLKNFLHSSGGQRRPPQQQQHLGSDASFRSQSREGGNESAISQLFPGGNVFGDIGKASAQSSSTSGFSSGFSNSSVSSNKQFNSSIYGTDMMSPPSYSSLTDQGADDKSHKSSHSSNSVENQWKNPHSFSSGTPSSKTSSQQRSLESPAYDDNSNTSAHSNISSKSTSISIVKGQASESRTQTSLDSSAASYFATDQLSSHAKPSSTKSHTSGNHNTSSSKSSPATAPSSSAPSSIASPPSNFSLDPYSNLYGSYGTYPGGLPSSNYYSPYSYAPGFLPDPKSSLSSKTSSDPGQTPAAPVSRTSSKSSSRSETKKTSHESRSSRSDLSAPPPAAPPAGSDSATCPPSSSAAAPAYNPMMMSPSFNPTPCQYPPPPAASTTANPFTAAAANYPNPYASPYGYPPANQFESDLARASMYSAFHRPDPGQFPTSSPLDPTSPYLSLPAHSRGMNPSATPAGSFYPQNVYSGQYGSSRDPYSYPANPFMMPPAAYSGIAPAPSSSSSTSSDQAPSQ